MGKQKISWKTDICQDHEQQIWVNKNCYKKLIKHKIIEHTIYYVKQRKVEGKNCVDKRYMRVTFVYTKKVEIQLL